MVTGYSQYEREEDNRERKPEQEADVGRAPGAERRRQRPLHRVTRDLAERSNDGEGNPERGDGEHGGDRLAGRPRCRSQHVVHVHVGGEAPFVGERAIDHTGLFDDDEPVVEQVLCEFVGGDKLVPLMSAARQPA